MKSPSVILTGTAGLIAMLMGLFIGGCARSLPDSAKVEIGGKAAALPAVRLTNIDLQTNALPDADLIQLYDLTPTAAPTDGDRPPDSARSFLLGEINVPVQRLRELRGDAAKHFLSLWRQVEFTGGPGLLCHHPAFAFRTFDKARNLTFQTSICWGCGNLILRHLGGESFYGFNSGGPGSQALLDHCKRLTSDPAARAPGEAGVPPVRNGPMQSYVPDALDAFNDKSTDTTDADLAALHGYSKLQHLAVFGTAITNDGLATLETLTGLQSLTIRSNRVTDAGIVHLRPLRKLTSLDLSEMSLTDRSLDSLADLTVLRNLYLGASSAEYHTSRARRITDAGLMRLGKLRAVRSLILSGTSVSDAGLMRLKSLAALEELHLSGTAVSGTGLGDLKHLASLKDLYLARCDVTDAGLAAIALLPNLEQLDLSEARGVTEEGLAALSRCPKLYRLTLRGTRVNDAAVAQLAAFPALSHLDLKGCQITDAAIPSIAGIKKLSYVWIGESQLTPAGVDRLKAAVTRGAMVQN